MIPKNKAAALMLVLFLALALVGCRMSSTPQAVVPPEPVIPTATEVEPTPEATPTPAWEPYLLHRIVHDDESVRSVAFSPDGGAFAAGIFLNAFVYDAATGDRILSVPHHHTVDNLAYSPDGLVLAGGQANRGVLLSDATSGNEIQTLGSGFDSRLAFSPDGETIATGNREGVVWFWRVSDGESLNELDAGDQGYLTSLAFSPDGQMLAAGYFNCDVNLWQVSSGELLHTLERNDFEVCIYHGVAFSPDGQLLAGSGATREFNDIIRVWHTSDGSVFAELSGDSEILAVEFSPDGKLLAAGSRQSVTLWELPELTLRHSIAVTPVDGETDWVTDLAFSPDSRSLAVGRWNGMLELWQVQE